MGADDEFARVLTRLHKNMVTSDSENVEDDDEVVNLAKAKIKNLKLKTSVEETELQIKEVHEENRAEIMRMREECASLHELAEDNMDKFDVEMVQSAVDVQYGPTEMFKLMPTLLPATEVATLQGYDCPDVPAVHKILLDLLSEKCDKNRRIELDRVLRKIASIHDKEDLVDVILPLHDLNFSDLLLGNHIWQQLGLTDQTVKELQQRIEDTDAKRQDALEKDEIILSEQLHEEVIRLLAEFIKCIQDRIKIVEGQGSRPDLLTKLGLFKQGAYGTIEKFKTQQLKLKDRFAVDQTTLAEMDDALQAENKTKTLEFQRFQTSNADAITDNENRQADLFDQIVQLQAQMKALGDVRFELVNDRMDVTEKEAKRAALYTKQRQVHAEHAKVYVALQSRADQCLDLLKSTEEYVDKGSEAIWVNSEKIANHLATLLLDEKKNYLSVFRRYYLTCGELKYKKEKRQATIDRQVRHHEAQIEFAKETLDPDTKKYQKMKADVLVLREECEKKIWTLEQKMDAATDLFEPTAKSLDDSGISFLHPAIELEEINVSRRANMNEAVKSYVKKETDDVEFEDEDVNITHHEVQKVKTTAHGGLATSVGMVASSKAVSCTSPNKMLKGGVKGSPRRAKSPGGGPGARPNLLLRRTRVDDDGSF